MASCFVEADKEFIEETQVRTKTKKIWTTRLKFSKQWVKTRGKNEQLEYEVPEINEALDNFALDLINK